MNVAHSYFYILLQEVHPRKPTWNLKITLLKRKLIFQTSIVGFHVTFRDFSRVYEQIPVVTVIGLC